LPELPEVENVVRDLKELIGKKISFNKLLDDRVFKTPFYNMAGKNVIIENIERYGKYIVLKFNTYAMIIHLGMAGKLIIDDSKYEVPKHCSWLIHFTNGQQLRFIDHRYFGNIWHMPYDKCINYIYSHIGPEIWDINVESFIIRTRQPKYKNKEIKVLLLDQKYIAGVGNIYASEICHEAFLNPHKLIQELSDKQIENIYYCIKRVLEKAIKNGGTTLRDYRNAKNEKGNNQNFLKVYKQLECKRCNLLITKEKIKDRMTYWCDGCQK
jgi:formamidopyrimidine-DNA glycosylase